MQAQIDREAEVPHGSPICRDSTRRRTPNSTHCPTRPRRLVVPPIAVDRGINDQVDQDA